jgi:hypothetical protein
MAIPAIGPTTAPAIQAFEEPFEDDAGTFPLTAPPVKSPLREELMVGVDNRYVLPPIVNNACDPVVGDVCTAALFLLSNSFVTLGRRDSRLTRGCGTYSDGRGWYRSVVGCGTAIEAAILRERMLVIQIAEEVSGVTSITGVAMRSGSNTGSYPKTGDELRGGTYHWNETPPDTTRVDGAMQAVAMP